MVSGLVSSTSGWCFGISNYLIPYPHLVLIDLPIFISNLWVTRPARSQIDEPKNQAYHYGPADDVSDGHGQQVCHEEITPG